MRWALTFAVGFVSSCGAAATGPNATGRDPVNVVDDALLEAALRCEPPITPRNTHAIACPSQRLATVQPEKRKGRRAFQRPNGDEVLVVSNQEMDQRLKSQDDIHYLSVNLKWVNEATVFVTLGGGLASNNPDEMFGSGCGRSTYTIVKRAAGWECGGRVAK